jgi:hypothetical protein
MLRRRVRLQLISRDMIRLFGGFFLVNANPSVLDDPELPVQVFSR